MSTIQVEGRNDLDLPDRMKIHIRESGSIVLEFDGVLKSFEIDSREADAFLKIALELFPNEIRS